MSRRKKIYIGIATAFWVACCVCVAFLSAVAQINKNGDVSDDFLTITWTAKGSDSSASNGSAEVTRAGNIITAKVTDDYKNCGGSQQYKTTTFTFTLTPKSNSTISVSYTVNDGDVQELVCTQDSPKQFVVTSDGKSGQQVFEIELTIRVIENKTVFFVPSWQSGSQATVALGDGTQYVIDSQYLDDTGKQIDEFTAVSSVPADGYIFEGWCARSKSGAFQRLGGDTENVSVSLQSLGTDTWYISPMFRKEEENQVEPFIVKGTELKSFYLDEAMFYAQSTGASVVIVNRNSSVAIANGEECVIPKGVTLLIPYDSGNTLCTTEPSIDVTGFMLYDSVDWKTPKLFRKLSMESGVNLIVEGAISLSGMQCADQGNNGMPTGDTSVISMASGSSITVNSGGFLYAWGYITGQGEVNIKSGGTVYENFQLRDWRGGTAASNMLNNDQKVFPSSQYYVQNVEVKMTLEAGAEEYAYMSLVASKIVGKASVPFIGSTGMFRLANGTKIVKDYLEEEDRLQIDVYGDLDMSALLLSVELYNMDSSKYVLPITNNLFVNVHHGTVKFSQDMAFLPGSELVIGEKATVEVAEGVNVFVYDLDQWRDKKFVYSSRDVSPLPFVGANWGEPNDRPTMADARIEVNGTLDVSEGYLFTTTGTTPGGANICSTGNGTIIIGSINASQKTYQATQSNTSISFVEVLITPAKLKNADGNYVSTQNDIQGVVEYKYVNNNWQGVLKVYKNNTVSEANLGVLIQYRTESYLWLNASCYVNFLKDKDGALLANNGLSVTSGGVTNTYNLADQTFSNEDGIQIVMSGDTVYIVKKIVAKEIPDEIKFTISYVDAEANVTFVSEVVTADFKKDMANDPVGQAYISFGNAAKDYFTKVEVGTQTKPTLNNTMDPSKPQADAQIFEGLSISTTGASIYFDEALRLSVGYQLSGINSTTVTINNETYTVVQVGVLLKEMGIDASGKWVGDTVLTTANSTACLVYNTMNGVTAPDWYLPNQPNVPNVSISGDAVVDAFATSGEATFNLTASQYKKGFSLRAFAVLQKGSGENAEYYCIYGKQYGYGLEAYIDRSFGKDTNAFDKLLIETWNLANAVA